MISKAIGSAAIGLAKLGLSMGKAAGTAALWGGKKIGKAALWVAPRVGKGFLGVAGKVGETVAEPFTVANRARTADNYLDLISSVGDRMITRNREGNLRLTKAGLGILGGLTMYSKLQDSYYDVKAENLGTVANKPVTATPNYQPVKYGREITPFSGGATGDLVFALHNLR